MKQIVIILLFILLLSNAIGQENDHFESYPTRIELKSIDDSTYWNLFYKNNVDSDGFILPVVVDDTEFFVEFPGGDSELEKFIIKNLSYPDSEKQAKIQGTVYVSFFINEIGKVSNVNIIRGLSSDINREVIKMILLMPNWIWDDRMKKKEREFTKVLSINFSL